MLGRIILVMGVGSETKGRGEPSYSIVHPGYPGDPMQRSRILARGSQMPAENVDALICMLAPRGFEGSSKESSWDPRGMKFEPCVG